MKTAYKYKVIEVVKVVDGDTYYLKIDLGFEIHMVKRFHLVGFDTPERGHSLFDAATDFAKKTLDMGDGREICVYTMGKKDGEWCASVVVEVNEGKTFDLGPELAKAGLAKVIGTKWPKET